jgi:hypothetical protein
VSVPNAKQTGKTAQVIYAVGEAAGPIMLADLDFADYVVNDQAFCKSSAAHMYSGIISSVYVGQL